MISRIETALNALRGTKPLVLNLTNYVTMDFMANSLLAIGAAPIMTVCDEELEELIQIAAAVNINIGTLERGFIERCLLAARLAHKHHKPVLLDPVGAGATQLRTKAAIELIPYAAIIRGNASEVMALVQSGNKTLGVESVNTTTQAKTAAINLASCHPCTVVISGPVDFITDGTQQIEVPYGSDLMPLITGMGCTMAALISAFSGVIENYFEASVLATHYMGLCGALAAKSSVHPGTFRTQFIDNLHAADFQKLSDIYAE